MNLRDWLRSFRRNEPTSAAAVRRQLASLREQRDVTVSQRDLVALDAVNDEVSAVRWTHLDNAVCDLDRRIAVFASALPQAEAREAEIARQAEAALRAKRLQDFERRTAEAEAFIASVLASMPSGEVLTKARDLRDALRKEAGALRTWSDSVHVRRPIDPLEALVTGMQHRIDRVSRARWIGSSPITLGGTSAEELAKASARVEALNGRTDAR